MEGPEHGGHLEGFPHGSDVPFDIPPGDFLRFAGWIRLGEPEHAASAGSDAIRRLSLSELGVFVGIPGSGERDRNFLGSSWCATDRLLRSLPAAQITPRCGADVG